MVSRYLIIIVLPAMLLTLLLPGHVAFGQDVLRASGGTNLSVDKVISEEFATLTGPTIRETDSGQLTQGGTIRLTLPEEYKWDTSLESTDITITIDAVGSNNTDLMMVFNGITSDVYAEFLVTEQSRTAGQGRGPGRVSINGLRLRPVVAEGVPNDGMISNTGTINLSANFGDLSMVAGSMAKIRVETQSDGGGELVSSGDDLQLSAGQSLDVFAIGRDIGDNFVENVALANESDWSLLDIGGDVEPSALQPAPGLNRATFQSTATGSARIEAFYAGMETITPSGIITVTPRSAVSLEIDTQPSATATAGEPFDDQPVLLLRDTYGNLVDDDDETVVTASIQTGVDEWSGNEPAFNLSETADEGVVTFSGLYLETANTVTLRFEGAGVGSVISNPVTVSHADPDNIVYLVQPSGTLPGSTITPPVEVQLKDEFGNTAPVSGVTVTIEAAGETNFLDQESYTAVTGSDGIAVFDDLEILDPFDAGDVQLEASFVGIATPVKSEPFSILGEGELAGFLIEDTGGGDIPSQTAGTEFSIRITAVTGDGVTVFDDFEDDFGHLSLILTAENAVFGGAQDTLFIDAEDFEDGVLDSFDIIVETAGTIRIKAEITDPVRSGRSNPFEVDPAGFNAAASVVTADPEEITADGLSTSTIIVRAKDAFGNQLTESPGETIFVTTDKGELSNDAGSQGQSAEADDQEDGTYTVTLTSTTVADTATVEAWVDEVEENGTFIGDTEVVFTAGNVTHFTIDLPDDEGQPADQTAGEEFDIDIQVRDQFGNRVTTFGGTATLSATSVISGGTETLVQLNEGVVTHPVTLTQSGEAHTLTVTWNANPSVTGTSDPFRIVAAEPDGAESQVSAVPTLLQNNPELESQIRVVLRDEFGNRVTVPYVVELILEQIEENNGPPTGDIGASLSTTQPGFSVETGDYRAKLNPSTKVELVRIKAAFENGVTEAIDDSADVNIVLPNTWTAGAGGPPSNRIDWNNPDNWSLPHVPSENDFVIIPGNVSPMPEVDLNVKVGSLQIEEGAPIILFGGNSIEVSSDIRIDGSLDIEDNTDMIVPGEFTGSGTFSAGENVMVKIGGDIDIAHFLVRTSGSVVRLNGVQPQSIQTQDFLAERLEVRNMVTVTQSARLIDVAVLDIADGYVLELEEGGEPGGGNIVFDAQNQLTGAGTLILNDNTLVLAGNSVLGNIDATEGTIVFGVREFDSEDNPLDPEDFPELKQQQIANLTDMKHAVINNHHDVRILEDVRFDGDLRLRKGNLIISSGRSLDAPNIEYIEGFIQFRRNITATPGWRMLSWPVKDAGFTELSDSLTVQGIDGTGDLSNRQPNLMWYDADTLNTTDLQRWRRPGSLEETIHRGRGYFFYVFGEVDGETDISNNLPATITATGAVYDPGESSFSFPVYYPHSNENNGNGNGNGNGNDDPFVEQAESGWNLIGNPLGASINWNDAISGEKGWEKDNLDDVIYIWKNAWETDEDDMNLLTGEYLTWNGGTGSLGNGLITPFQAFWVKAHDEAPGLKLERQAKTTGGTFRQKAPAEEEIRQIVLTLEAGGLQTSTYLHFTDRGKIGIDPADAYLLEPMADTFLNFYSLPPDDDQPEIPLVINHLPRKHEGTYEIPLGVRGYKNGEPVHGTYKVSLDPQTSFPGNWEVRLKDHVTGRIVHLNEKKAGGETALFATQIDYFRGQKERIEVPGMNRGERQMPVLADIGRNPPVTSESTGNRKTVDDDKNSHSSSGAATEQRLYSGVDYPFTLYVTPDKLQDGDIPNQIFLNQNYPNPFNPATTIRFGLPEDQNVRLEVFDILGRRVQTLVDDRMDQGVHSIRFDATRYASGVYIYRLRAGDKVLVRKMTYIR